MILYLVQHGDSVPEQVDPNRPLSDKGRADIEKMAALLRESGVQVKQVFHSGKLRAAQTAEILAATVLRPGTIERTDGLNPNDAVEPFAGRFKDSADDTMLVGHLPFMAKMAGYLLTGDVGRSVVSFQPGSVACLERAGSGAWSVFWMIRPELCESIAVVPKI